MFLRKNLHEVYWKMERLIAPSLRYSQYEYEEVLDAHVTTGLRWLDLGCGHHLLPPWRFEQEKRLIGKCSLVVGIDADWTSLTKHRTISLAVLGNISTLPFKDDSFDLVTANMVVEHLGEPALQFREVNRILRAGGLFIFHTPNARGYATKLARVIPDGVKSALIGLLQGRAAEDVFKTHYRANTRAGVTRLADATGFRVLEIKSIVSSAETAVIPPLAALELVWIRLLQTERLREFRTNLIVTLQKRTECMPTQSRNGG